MVVSSWFPFKAAEARGIPKRPAAHIGGGLLVRRTAIRFQKGLELFLVGLAVGFPDAHIASSEPLAGDQFAQPKHHLQHLLSIHLPRTPVR